MQEKTKTFNDWEDGLVDYLQVGDQIDEMLYDNFLNILPPIDIKSNPIVLGGFQVSEPVRDAIDANGKTRALYSTFGMSGGEYYYLGLNFAGEVNSTYTPVDYTTLNRG